MQWFEPIIGFALARPYLMVMVLLLVAGFGLPMPEDITIALAGYIAWHDGTLDADSTRHLLWPLGLWTLWWVVAGDSIVFGLGRLLGPGALDHRWVKPWMPAARRRRVERGFDKYGNGILFFARFMPGLRTPIFFTAGTMGIPWWRLWLYDGGAALLSVPAIYFAVWWLAKSVDGSFQRAWDIVSQYKMVVIPAAVIFIAYYAYKIATRAPDPEDLEPPAGAAAETGQDADLTTTKDQAPTK